MIFLLIAWLALFVFIVTLVVERSAKDVKTKRSVRSFQLLLIIFMTLYAIIGILSNDPLSELVCEVTNFCVPVVVEWVVYVGILGLLLWKFILVDMKTDIRILKFEGRQIRERIGAVEGTLKVVETNTNTLIANLLQESGRRKPRR